MNTISLENFQQNGYQSTETSATLSPDSSDHSTPSDNVIIHIHEDEKAPYTALPEKQVTDLTNQVREMRAEIDAMKQAGKCDGSTWKTLALISITYGLAHLYFKHVLQTEHYYLDPVVPTGGYWISRFFGPEEIATKVKNFFSRERTE